MQLVLVLYKIPINTIRMITLQWNDEKSSKGHGSTEKMRLLPVWFQSMYFVHFADGNTYILQCVMVQCALGWEDLAGRRKVGGQKISMVEKYVWMVGENIWMVSKRFGWWVRRFVWWSKERALPIDWKLQNGRLCNNSPPGERPGEGAVSAYTTTEHQGQENCAHF